MNDLKRFEKWMRKIRNVHRASTELMLPAYDRIIENQKSLPNYKPIELCDQKKDLRNNDLFFMLYAITFIIAIFCVISFIPDLLIYLSGL